MYKVGLKRNGKPYKYVYNTRPENLMQHKIGVIKCLKCDEEFRSAHKFNRICSNCKKMNKTYDSNYLHNREWYL